jgi:hypothetical protein
LYVARHNTLHKYYSLHPMQCNCMYVQYPCRILTLKCAHHYIHRRIRIENVLFITSNAIQLYVCMYVCMYNTLLTLICADHYIQCNIFSCTILLQDLELINNVQFIASNPIHTFIGMNMHAYIHICIHYNSYINS